ACALLARGLPVYSSTPRGLRSSNPPQAGQIQLNQISPPAQFAACDCGRYSHRVHRGSPNLRALVTLALNLIRLEGAVNGHQYPTHQQLRASSISAATLAACQLLLQ